MTGKRTMQNGIYLVVDPAMEGSQLIQKIKASLEAGICAIQLLDNFPEGSDAVGLIEEVCNLAHRCDVPALVNNRWQYMKHTQLDGVHFDELPASLDEIREAIKREILIGITCGNDWNKLNLAASQRADYISFCSLFPSGTQNSCELVKKETIKMACEKFDMPMFVAGGITPENISSLHELRYSGIAIVSGIMNAHDPAKAINRYKSNSNL